jgi:hypothetical protein
MEEIKYSKVNNYIKFQDILKQNIGKEIRLNLKTEFNRDKDFSSYQYMFKSLEATGIIINTTPYHLLLQISSKYNECRFVRYLDIKEYCIIS